MRCKSALNTMHSITFEYCSGMRALLLLLTFASPAYAVPLPLVCELTSEENPAFVIRLETRTRTALRGALTHEGKTLGTMATSRPNSFLQSIWSFQSGDVAHSGTAVLFTDEKVWMGELGINSTSEHRVHRAWLWRNSRCERMGQTGQAKQQKNPGAVVSLLAEKRRPIADLCCHSLKRMMFISPYG